MTQYRRTYSPPPLSGEIPVTVDIDQPTNAELSQQIGALSAQVTACHAASLRSQAASDSAVTEVLQLRNDVRQIRKTQLEDHAPRITEVEREQKSQRRSIGPTVKLARSTS